MTVNNNRISLTPGIPTYRQARAFMEAIDGEPYTTFRNMEAHIWNQVGSPQENVDWSDPEAWIPVRLEGEEQILALKLWRKTRGLVNPRHSIGSWRLANKYRLLAQDGDGLLGITQDGQEFLKNTEGKQVVLIDRQEGLLSILQTVSEHSPGKRSDILPDYIEFCTSYTNYNSDAVFKSSLYDRLVNLIDRGFVTLSGVMYTITDKGIAYLQKYAGQIPGRAVTSKQTNLQKLSRDINQAARDELLKYLGKMDPYKFEHLVRLLLEEMGYINVSVTAPSNDKGVDVVADIELGISSVREVVQVKRISGSINRVILDQLRGSLHRFKALRGTIITIGTFSNGAKTASLESGAAPVTLIDGEKLLDLLTQYEIGLSKKPLLILEFDDKKLRQFEDESPVINSTEA